MYKLIVIFLITFLFSCSSESVKEKINKAGDIAGQATGEFVEGASKGIQKAFDVEVFLDEELKNAGIEIGKSSVENDSIGKDNLLIVYIVFTKKFKGTITAKVFDSNEKEMGRSKALLSGKVDETKFVEFHFDKRTDIDSKNKITIE